MVPGERIGLQIDRALIQDALGTFVNVALEAIELDRTRSRSCSPED